MYLTVQVVKCKVVVTLDGEAYYRRCLGIIADTEDAEDAFSGVKTLWSVKDRHSRERWERHRTTALLATQFSSNIVQPLSPRLNLGLTTCTDWYRMYLTVQLECQGAVACLVHRFPPSPARPPSKRSA